MKKSIYELDNAEYTKYVKEFDDTEFGKKTYKNQKNALLYILFAFFLYFAFYIIDIAIIDNGETSMQALYSLPILLLVGGIVIYGYNFLSRKICFYRWLKIKHNIEY